MKLLPTLKKRSDFLATKASGIHIATKGLVLQAKPAEHDEIRIGYTVSKKVGNAVVRNRVKRRLRHLATQVLNDPRWPQGWEYVLIGRFAAKTRDFDALKKDLRYALHQVHSSQLSVISDQKEKSDDR